MLALAVSLARATDFSKNKVQTQDYRFRSLKTDNFLIYFYTGGEKLADYTARVAEEFYKSLSSELNVSRGDLIPIIIYNSPNEFAETNVITDVIEEGVGGFSELFKNRVVVPFDGSYARYRHVLEHEITHVFQFELFYKPRAANLLSVVENFQIPLWIAEGMAEFTSGNVDLGNEIFMRDLVLNDRLLSIDELNYYYGYLAYREGEAIFRYIAERYGRRKVFEFLHQFKNLQNVTDAFEKCFGLSTKKFSREFEDYLRQKYWPQIVKDENFNKLGKLLTDHIADGSVYNTSPAISPSGNMVAFISDRNEYNDIYVISALDGRVLKHLVSGERSGGFESVHPYRGGISWAPDETAIALASKSRGRDYLTVVDYPSGKVRKRLAWNLDAIYSPEYSPDGRRIALVGLKDGQSDIYLCDLATEKLTRVTADIYEDREPVFSPGGDSILFISDRPDSGVWRPGEYAVFTWTTFRAIERVTPRAEYLAHPTFLPGGEKIAFVTGDSSYNMIIYSLRTGRAEQRTDFTGGVYYPTFARDAERLIFAYYRNLGWDITSIKHPLTEIPRDADSAVTDWALKPDSTADTYSAGEPEEGRVKPYAFNLTPDYAIGAASYSSDGGAAGQLYLSLSDVLGNHRFYLTTDLIQDILNSDLSLAYWYLPRRIDYGVGFYQYFDYNLDWPSWLKDSSTVLFGRRNLGLSGIASYPFDKYSRLDAGVTPQLSEYTWYHQLPTGNWAQDSSGWKKVFLLDGAYVFDNTYWGTMTAPERGVRLRLEAMSPVLSDLKYATVYLDARGYLKVAKRFVWANQFFGLASFGPDADRMTIGGENVRGYQYGEFFDKPGTRALFLSSELRHPLVDRVKLAFPLPLDLTDIRGVTYLDAGVAWDQRLPRLYDFTNHRLDDLKVGIGAGLRFQISYFLLKLDYGYPFSALRVADDSTGAERNRTGSWYFSIGTDF